MPPNVDFPEADYSAPTSIPDLFMPDVPAPLDLELYPPQPITLPVFTMPTELITPVQIITSISTNDFTYTVSITGSHSMTGTGPYTMVNGLLSDGRGLIDSVMSYTLWLSGEIGRMQHTDSFTIATAPTNYAPDLPRPMANVGYTFELLASDMYTRRRYTVEAWAGVFGYTVSLPIQLAKSLYELFRFFGPFGLFIIWLVAVMLPTVLGFNILLFLKTSVVRLFRFVITLAEWGIGLIERLMTAINWLLDWLWKLWEAIPFIN